MKVKVDLDWHPVESPTGMGWRCEALDCVFVAIPATVNVKGWRLICFNKALPGSTRPIGVNGNLMPTFEKAPVWATKEDCFAAVRKFIKTQAEKTRT